MTIASSVSASDASGRQWDVVVVGAGPGGTAVAKRLAAAGRHVLILDKSTFPRDKVCGGCLNVRSLTMLSLIFGDCLVDKLDGSPIEGCRFVFPRCQIVLPIKPMGPHQPLSISRGTLDALLLTSAVSAGAHFIGGCRVHSSSLVDGCRRLEVQTDGQRLTVRTDCVIAADGLGSRLADEAGLLILAKHTTSSKVGASLLMPDTAIALPPSEIWMVPSTKGYVGLARLDGHRLVLSAALNARALQGSSPKLLMESILANAHLQLGGGSSSELAGQCSDDRQVKILTCPALRRQVSRPWAERLLLVGDAAGYHEPITGEGIAWALESAAVASEVLVDGWRADTGQRYEASWRRDVGNRRRLVRLAAGLMARPWAASIALALTASIPAIGRRIVAALNTPAPLEARP